MGRSFGSPQTALFFSKTVIECSAQWIAICFCYVLDHIQFDLPFGISRGQSRGSNPRGSHTCCIVVLSDWFIFSRESYFSTVTYSRCSILLRIGNDYWEPTAGGASFDEFSTTARAVAGLPGVWRVEVRYTCDTLQRDTYRYHLSVTSHTCDYV